MSRKLKLIVQCDNCSDEKSVMLNNFISNPELATDGAWYHNDEDDLCSNCYEVLNKFSEGKLRA